jgi:ubiquitin carboxyl-terminal hydrolase 36/42
MDDTKSCLLPTIPVSEFLTPRPLVEALSKLEKRQHVTAVGIGNSENNCYINVVMQCLTYSTPLYVYLAQKLHSRKCRSYSWEFCVWCKLESFVSLMYSTNAKSHVLRVDDFLWNLKVFGEFTRGHQDDASLFMTGLVERLQQDEFRVHGVAKPSVDQENTTLMHQLFGCYLVYSNTCRACGGTKKRFEYVFSLPLALEREAPIEDVLKAHFTTEELEGTCSLCKQRGTLERRTQVYQTHSLVVLQLMRFDFERNKIHTAVSIKNELDLRPFMHPEGETTECVYETYALIVHRGRTLNGGHYVAFLKSSDTGQWFEADDEDVKQCDEARVLEQNAHCIFYRKRYLATRTNLGDVAAEPDQKEKKVEEEAICSSVKSAPVTVSQAVPAVLSSCSRCGESKSCSLCRLAAAYGAAKIPPTSHVFY